MLQFSPLRLCRANLHLILSIALLSYSTLTAASCSCYTTTGPSGNQTYNHYAFHDFRSLSSQLSTKQQLPTDPNFPNPSHGLETSAYFNSSDFADNWYIESGSQNPSPAFPVKQINTAYAITIDQDNSTSSSSNTVLSMVSTRMGEYQSAAQIQTAVANMTHASIRISARLMGPPGACAGFFIYGNDTNETDIELLTNDTSSLFHATNHPSQDASGNIIPGASTITSIPANGTANGTTNGSFTDWNDWRIDWLPGLSQWFINGDLVLNKTYAVPRIPAYLGINMWGNGGTWTGNMTVGDSATLQIRYVEIAYNQSGDSDTGSCSGSSVCVVNDNNGGTNSVPSWAPSRPQGLGAWTWSLLLGVGLWSIL